MEAMTLTCIQCGIEFVFSVQERKRYVAKGFAVPKRCPECRKKKARGIETDNNRKDTAKRRRSRRKQASELFEW
jgi:hypothetical protein